MAIVRCPKCHNSFSTYASVGTRVHCPHCRRVDPSGDSSAPAPDYSFTMPDSDPPAPAPADPPVASSYDSGGGGDFGGGGSSSDF